MIKIDLMGGKFSPKTFNTIKEALKNTGSSTVEIICYMHHSLFLQFNIMDWKSTIFSTVLMDDPATGFRIDYRFMGYSLVRDIDLNPNTISFKTIEEEICRVINVNDIYEGLPYRRIK